MSGEASESVDHRIQRVLRSAAQVEGFEVSDADRIVILQVTPQEYMMRVTDREGQVHGIPFTVEAKRR